MITLPLLDPDPSAPFPDPRGALDDPAGLLAAGGDLSPTRLLNAYRHGVFPWFSEGQPILWWSPDPRMVVAPSRLHLSRRFRRQLRQCDWTLTADTAFERVIASCAGLPRRGQRGTWITAGMRHAYVELHRLGHAHSVEVWDAGELVGGIYGIAIGRMFFGESMFSRRPGGSKVAIAALARQLAHWQFELIDGQVESDHLSTLGFSPLPRDAFLLRCRAATAHPTPTADDWRQAFQRIQARALADHVAAG